MGKNNQFLSLVFLLISHLSIGQFSLSDLQRAGINSESDLQKLGVSESEIESLKQEYFESKGNNEKSEKEVQESSAIPDAPKKEKPVVLKSQKIEDEPEKIYGQSIFRSGAVTVQKNSDRIIPPPNYILGSGDRISITIWGTSQFNGEFLIDEFGNITPRVVGRINLKGKTFNQAKEIIKTRFSQSYRFNPSQFAVSLSYSKVISVNIVGDVISPGTYSIPSINSPFNILSLSKGPNENGSVRNIAVVRNGKIIDNLDVYEFMNKPIKSSLTYLFDGDFILVPSIGNVVSINGQVNRTGNFEIKENETLADLINFAGGFKANANQTSISIVRQTENGKIVLSHSFSNAKNIKLLNGDEIIIAQNTQTISNKVTIKGEVYSPGIYEFKEGETFDALLKRTNGLTSEAYLKAAHIYRLNDDLQREIIPINLSDSNKYYLTKIKDLDEIMIFNKRNFIDTNFIAVNGLVRKSGKVEFKRGMTLKDAITLVGGSYPQADLTRIEIERIDFDNPSNDTLNYVKILIKNFNLDSDFKLEAFDILNIRALPKFKFQETVEIIGEVKYPGIYSLSGDRVQLSDVVKRAGGVTNIAYGEKAYIERTEDSLGIILLDLELVLKNEKDPNNYSLRPGDKIFVPRVNDIVSISGAIGAQFVDKEENINVAFRKGKRASHYIKKYAGGYDKRANRKNVYGITLNGQVKRSKLFGLIKPKIEKGDKIVVKYLPEKKERQKGEKIDWNRAIENTTIKVTGVLTLYILFQNAFGA